MRVGWGFWCVYPRAKPGRQCRSGPWWIVELLFTCKVLLYFFIGRVIGVLEDERLRLGFRLNDTCC